MEHHDVKSNTCIDFNKEINYKDPKFKIGDFVIILKYKNIFSKDSTPNWCQEVFVFKKVKNTLLRTHVINDLKGEEIVGTYYENELQKKKSKTI